MLMTVVSVLVFIAIGALIGFAAKRLLFEKASATISILLGIVGSTGLSWGASLLGWGSGILGFSAWGIFAAIIGACLLSGIYGFVANRRASHAYSNV